MSEILHSPYELLSEQIAKETLQRIQEINDPVLFYTRMTQLISGAIFEGIHFGLNAVDSFEAQGPSELMTVYAAGIEEGKRIERGES